MPVNHSFLRWVLAPATLLALIVTASPAKADFLGRGRAAFPFPIPGGSLGIPLPGGGSLPLPIPSGNSGSLGIPIPGGGTFQLPIPTGGGQYPSGNSGTLDLPLPGGGSFPLPLPGGGGGGNDFPIPGGGGGGATFPIPLPGGGGEATNLPVPSSDGGAYLPGGKPSGYEAMRVGGRVARIGQFPLHVYNADGSRDALLAGAVRQWNQAGQQVGIGSLFEIVTHPGFADFSVDWSGKGLPSGVLGSAQMKTSGGKVVPTRLTMRPDMDRPQSHVQEILTHELGHMVGLEHSDVAQDLMYRTERTGRHSGSGLTQRDLAMVKWLYSQRDYVPIGR